MQGAYKSVKENILQYPGTGHFIHEMPFVWLINSAIAGTEYNKINYAVKNYINTGKLLTWMCILMMALPISVAPKNVPNGTRKWPHVMPARSNRGLGI